MLLLLLLPLRRSLELRDDALEREEDDHIGGHGSMTQTQHSPP